MVRFDDLFQEMPIVAILRGVTPTEVESICSVLAEENIRLIEVPLNSPEPFESIKIVRDKMAGQVLIGAGTVTSVEDAIKVKKAGGQYLVSPNCDEDVIDWAVENHMEILPGIFTPTEAFKAIQSGAKYLKCFPAGSMNKNYFSQLNAVLPDSVKLLTVGGVTTSEMKEYMQLGIDGFGVGGDLYKPGDSPELVKAKAKSLVTSIKRN